MNEEGRNIIMADIQGMWYDFTPQPRRNDQEQINIYVTSIIQFIIINPCISAVQILDNLSQIPQVGSRSQILRLFGGWRTFASTIGRMELLRTGIATGRLNNFPVTTRAPEEGEAGGALPVPDGHISWWAPQVGTNTPPFLFRMVQTEGDSLHRYPHWGTYTDDNSEENLNETDSQSEDA